MRLLLDTYAYSALMAGDPPAKNQVRVAEHVYLAMPVIGELLYGFSLGRRDAENRSHGLLAHLFLLSIVRLSARTVIALGPG
jgi:predicted nucleic acid-binding protein